MRVTTTQSGDLTVLEVSGEFTWDSVARFSEAVDRAFKESRRDFVVDLRHVEFIDSVGLEALTALQRRCEEQLGMVRFCGPNPDVKKVFELTRLDRNLTIHDEMEEAMASFA
jgi:anti-sigma B factor antagonist